MDVKGVGDLGSYNSMINESIVNRTKNQANDVSKFEEILRKTASENTADPQASEPSHSSKFAKIDKTDKLYEQCMELEVFMIKTLVSSMRNTVQKTGLIDQSYAGKMYEDMLYDEYAKDFAKNANFGMAEMAYLELTGQRGKIVK
jgi:flagellar protein FlgJ